VGEPRFQLPDSLALPALRSWCLALVLSVGCLLMGQAQATVLEELSFEALVAQSKAIVVGRVSDSRQEQLGDLIYTTITIEVADTVKGGAASPIELRFVGGEYAGVTVEIEGQFIPAVQSYGVFFIADLASPMVNPLTGWYQGYFPLFTDASGIEYLDMRQRPDFVVPGLESNPLASKMQSLGFSQDAIARKVPERGVFRWSDFRAAIAGEVQRAVGSALGTRP
jgi:hypothetical protein